MSHRDRWDDRRDDRRAYIPNKRSADGSGDSDYKRNKANNRDNMDVDHHSENPLTLPKHLQYWMDSDKDIIVYSSKNYETSLGAEIRALEFNLELAELEVEKWDNQIQSIEQTLKEIDEF